MDTQLPIDQQHIDDSPSVHELQEAIETAQGFIIDLEHDIENEESVIEASEKEINRLKQLIAKEQDYISYAQSEIKRNK